MHGLAEVLSFGEPLKTCLAPKIQWLEYAVEGSTSQTHTGSNSTLLNALTGKCKHLMPNTHRGWTGHYSNNQKNFWKNMQILIQSCHSVKIGLGERPPILWFRSPTIPLDLALNVCQGSVGFRWGTITGPYHANFSQVETQKCDPHWFYCLQWGVTTFFAKSVFVEINWNTSVDQNPGSTWIVCTMGHKNIARPLIFPITFWAKGRVTFLQ